MQWEQLSFLNPDSLYPAHPFDRGTNGKSDPFFDHRDSSFSHNYLRLSNNTAQAPDRQKVLERLLEKISQHDLPGWKYVGLYLRHKYRRNCKAQTLRSTTASLMQFLCFFRTSGKGKLAQLSREDIEAFVEDMQDRGLKPETVRTRLCAVYAFVRYAGEQKVLSYELLERKIRLKLPDRLPRAIDPEDVRQLLSVVDHTRDRALILLLLRSGMRIGELLNCTVDDMDIQQQKIFIYQADKTGVGRVVYYSEDAQQALLAWLRLRDPFKEKLFYGQGRGSLCYEAARSMFNKYVHKAGL